MVSVSRVVFVPRLMDATNLNAQVGNARAILGEWDWPGCCVSTLAYDEPDPRVASNPQVDIVRLWRRHAWMAHLFLRYLRPYDLIFYPGVHAADIAGLRWRRRLGLSTCVVATLEGLVGDKAREAEYTRHAGHPVFCQHVPPSVLSNLDEMYRNADHIIAISPFLARMGQTRFGDKFSVLPLGIDTSIFYRDFWKHPSRLCVVSAGGVKENKRPEMFLTLAQQYPQADFIWYGEGNLRTSLQARAAELGLDNLSFPGALAPQQLADAFRAADVFAMPSRSEGVPKVTQEAAACGLAQVIFGYYEAPSVVDGQNGFVVWSDEAFKEKLGELLDDFTLVETFGRAGAEMAIDLDWTAVARSWRRRLIEIAENR